MPGIKSTVSGVSVDFVRGGMKYLIVFAFAFVTVITCALSAAFADADEWAVFQTPAKELSVLLPGNVTTGWGDKEQDKSDKSDGIERYEASSADGVVLMSTLPLNGIEDFDDMAKEIHDTVKKENAEMKRNCEIEFAKNESGEGWTGKSYDVKTAERDMKILIARDKSNGELAVLYTVTPESATTEKVFGSLKMDPELIKKKAADRSAKSWHKMTHPTNFVEGVGIVFFWLGILTWIVAYLAFIVLAFSKHFMWGLGCIFVPFCWLAFLIKHPTPAWIAWAVQVVAGIATIAGVTMMPRSD